jgi:hypothetical protein
VETPEDSDNDEAKEYPSADREGDIGRGRRGRRGRQEGEGGREEREERESSEAREEGGTPREREGRRRSFSAPLFSVNSSI